MPKDKDFKQIVRGRMAKTGEAYSIARRHLLSNRVARTPTPELVAPTTAVRCLYCRAELDERTKFAHAVPESLGGRVGSKAVCCSGCNTSFSPLESLLSDALRGVSASVGAFTGDRKRVTHRRKIDGVTFTFWNGRGNRHVDPPTFDRATKRLVFPLPAGIDAQAALMAEQMWKHGLTPSALEDGTFYVEPQENPIPANLGSHWVESVFNIGNRGHRRVFVKMALELLARYDAVAARDGALGSARQFARLDRGEISFKPDAASEGSGLLAKTRTRFRIGHSVEVWTCGQHVLVKVAFFGKLIFTASLSSSWNSSPFSVAHILDPQDPSVALTRSSKRAGKPLTLWHEGMAKPAIDAFEAHVETVAYEKGVAAAATPISRDPGPILDAAMKARITAAFDRIVSKRGTRPARKREPKTGGALSSTPPGPAESSPKHCASCGHEQKWHTQETIPAGKYGAGGRCGWWKDPMFSPTEECRCAGFEDSRKGTPARTARRSNAKASIGRAFVNAHPEIQELARQWATHPEPLSEAGFRPLFPLVEKILKAALSVEGETVQGLTLIPLLQRCSSDRLRFFNLVFMCCDARGREAISNIRSAVMHADYSHDMAELRDGGWAGTEADYQKILPHRLHTMYLKLNYIVRQVDPQTGRFMRDWTAGRALCASCKGKGLAI